MNPSRLKRALRRRFGAGSSILPASTTDVLSLQRRTFDRAELVVRVFYVLTVCLAAHHFSRLPRLLGSESPDWLWPVGWLPMIGVPVGLAMIFSIYLPGALLAALFPHRRFFRAATFAGMLTFLGFNYSFGRIDHGYHFWLWCAGILVLLPKGSSESIRPHLATRQYYLAVFFFCQVACALFFSVAGTWKVSVAIYQAAIGESSAVSFDAFARQIAMQAAGHQEVTAVGRLIIEHPVVGWPFYVGAVYLEFFSVLAVLRPPLHRYWGVALMLFQVGTMLTLNVWSPWGIAIVGLLFVASPFGYETRGARSVLAELPLIKGALAVFGMAAKPSPS